MRADVGFGACTAGAAAEERRLVAGLAVAEEEGEAMAADGELAWAAGEPELPALTVMTEAMVCSVLAAAAGGGGAMDPS